MHHKDASTIFLQCSFQIFKSCSYFQNQIGFETTYNIRVSDSKDNFDTAITTFG